MEEQQEERGIFTFKREDEDDQPSSRLSRWPLHTFGSSKAQGSSYIKQTIRHEATPVNKLDKGKQVAVDTQAEDTHITTNSNEGEQQIVENPARRPPQIKWTAEQTNFVMTAKADDDKTWKEITDALKARWPKIKCTEKAVSMLHYRTQERAHVMEEDLPSKSDEARIATIFTNEQKAFIIDLKQQDATWKAIVKQVKQRWPNIIVTIHKVRRVVSKHKEANPSPEENLEVGNKMDQPSWRQEEPAQDKPRGQVSINKKQMEETLRKGLMAYNDPSRASTSRHNNPHRAEPARHKEHSSQTNAFTASTSAFAPTSKQDDDEPFPFSTRNGKGRPYLPEQVKFIMDMKAERKSIKDTIDVFNVKWPERRATKSSIEHVRSNYKNGKMPKPVVPTAVALGDAWFHLRNKLDPELGAAERHRIHDKQASRDGDNSSEWSSGDDGLSDISDAEDEEGSESGNEDESEDEDDGDAWEEEVQPERKRRRFDTGSKASTTKNRAPRAPLSKLDDENLSVDDDNNTNNKVDDGNEKQQKDDGENGEAIAKERVTAKEGAIPAIQARSTFTLSTIRSELGAHTIGINFGIEAQYHTIHKDLLCRKSSFFAARCAAEPQASELNLVQWSHLGHTFADIFSWAYGEDLERAFANQLRELCQHQGRDQTAANALSGHLVHLYCLAEKLGIPDLCDTTISLMGKLHTATQLPATGGDIKLAYRESGDRSGLRKYLARQFSYEMMVAEDETMQVCMGFAEGIPELMRDVFRLTMGVRGNEEKMRGLDVASGLVCEMHSHGPGADCNFSGITFGDTVFGGRVE